ncbi:MAG TPA: hypothetical protein VGM27_31595 [Acidobacteriaceae bacterium]
MDRFSAASSSRSVFSYETGGLGKAFVCREAVQAGNRKIEQTEIDSELSPVVHKMVKKHAAVTRFRR